MRCSGLALGLLLVAGGARAEDAKARARELVAHGTLYYGIKF